MNIIKSDRNLNESLKTFQLGSIELSYTDVGEGQLVVLLHGFPDTANTWEETQTILKNAGYRTCALYLRGYFPSDIPSDGDYRLATLVSDTIKLVEHLGYQKCIIVGHDWGALIAYAAAILYPDVVTGIVTVAIPPPKVSHTNWRERLARPHNIYLRWGNLAYWWVKWKNFKAIDFFYRQWSPNWLVPAQYIKHVKEMLSLPGRTTAAVDYYAAPMDKALEDIMNQPITQPIFVIFGLDEPNVRLEMFSKSMSVLVDGSKVTAFKNTGHWPHRESPENFHRELVQFLRGLSSQEH